MRNDAFWRFCYFFSVLGLDDSLRLEAQIHLMKSQPAYKKVFILGASNSREAFDMELLNKEFKDKKIAFYNFGIAGWQPVNMFMLRKKLLDKHPKAIFYVISPSNIYTDYDFTMLKYCFNPEIVPLFIKYYGFKNLVRAHQVGYIADAFLCDFSIFLKYRESIKRALVNGVKNFLGIEKVTNLVHFAYKDGWHPKSWYLGMIRNEKMKDKIKIGPSSDLNRYSFIAFAKYSISNGAKLIVIDGPEHPSVDLYMDKNIYSSYLSFLNKSSQELGFTFIQKDRLPNFSEEDYYDFYHLNASGRSKLTRFLKEYIESITSDVCSTK
jgi:hypothetical protein